MNSTSPLWCRAIIVTCFDFRLQHHLYAWAEKTIVGGYDRTSIAGSTKDCASVIDQVSLAYNIHHISDVYLINHEDCRAYGADGSFDKHVQDLIATKQALLLRFPNLNIFPFYLQLNGNFVEIPHMSS